MPKKETKILIIIILLIDIASIGAFVFLFSFTKNLIIESVNRENEIKTELKREDTMVLMKNDLELGKMYQEKLMNYMVPSGGTVDFIKTLEQIVSNSGIKSNITNVNNETYNKGDSIGAELIKINMSVTGEWKNIQFFLTSLENYPLKIDINKLSLSKFSNYVINGKNTPEWSGSFEFTVVKIKDTK
jgi:Tfp pilus assembly protein PilO